MSKCTSCKLMMVWAEAQGLTLNGGRPKVQRVVYNREEQKWPADVLSIILYVYIAALPCAAVASSATYQKTPPLPICTGAEEGTARKAQRMYRTNSPTGEDLSFCDREVKIKIPRGPRWCYFYCCGIDRLNSHCCSSKHDTLHGVGGCNVLGHTVVFIGQPVWQ